MNIIRAWKDPEYRASLSEAERALLPANPAGLIELNDTELSGAVGGLRYTDPRVCPPTPWVTCYLICTTIECP